VQIRIEVTHIRNVDFINVIVTKSCGSLIFSFNRQLGSVIYTTTSYQPFSRDPNYKLTTCRVISYSKVFKGIQRYSKAFDSHYFSLDLLDQEHYKFQIVYSLRNQAVSFCSRIVFGTYKPYQ